MLVRALTMAKGRSRQLLCVKPAPPVPDTKAIGTVITADLLHVKTSLSRYEMGVRSYQSFPRRWPPVDATTRNERTLEVRDSLEGKSGNTHARKDVIAIDLDEEGSLSGENDNHDANVWADAFEYQDRVLSAARLSQATPNDNEKENVDPVDNQPTGTAKEQWAKAGEGVAEPAVGKPRDDHFARTERQYPHVTLQPYRKPLAREEYFKMINYPTLSGRPPTVIYVTNENQLNSVLGRLKGPILSLDLEWVIRRTTNISLIQLSDAETVLLIQIFRFPRFPPKLRELIEDSSIVKCGVAIMGADMSKLRDLYNVWARGVCELSAFARLVDRADHGPQNRLISLSGLAKHYLGAHLSKGPVRSSNWNAIPLSAEQREYAAIDAYAGYLIFMELERRRQERPEFEGVWPVVKACPPRGASRILQTASDAGTNARPATDTRSSSRVTADEEARSFVTDPVTKPASKIKVRCYSTGRKERKF